jgi:hypothetical protein
LGASKMISVPIVCSTQTVHPSCVKISIISKRTEMSISHVPCHLGVPSSASKMISKPMVCLAQHCLQIERSEISHDSCHLGVSLGASKTIFEPIVCSTQTVHLSCVKISTISKWTKMSFHLSLPPKSTIRCVQNDF